MQYLLLFDKSKIKGKDGKFVDGVKTLFDKMEVFYTIRGLLCGGMAEWLIAAVLKTAVPQGTQSSNLCPSAI